MGAGADIKAGAGEGVLMRGKDGIHIGRATEGSRGWVGGTGTGLWGASFPNGGDAEGNGGRALDGGGNRAAQDIP